MHRWVLHYASSELHFLATRVETFKKLLVVIKQEIILLHRNIAIQILIVHT